MKSKVIVCKEIKYAEFPDLLTGADQEGNRYADMTHFLEKKGKTGTNHISLFQMNFLSMDKCSRCSLRCAERRHNHQRDQYRARTDYGTS